MKKQLHPLVGGTLLLTAAGLMTRLIGFFYKIFLSRAIGAEGIGIYQMIFPIYGVCYALTTSGAEIAVSRFVSREYGAGRRRCRRTHRGGRYAGTGKTEPGEHHRAVYLIEKATPAGETRRAFSVRR